MSLSIADQQSPQEEIGINNGTITQIIYEILYLKRKESAVARKYDLDLWRVKHLLALFKRNLNSIKVDNRRLLNKRKLMTALSN